MPEATTAKEAKTEVLQAVVPTEVADAIRKDAKAAIPEESVSRVTAQIICAHYAKRLRKTRRQHAA